MNNKFNVGDIVKITNNKSISNIGRIDKIEELYILNNMRKYWVNCLDAIGSVKCHEDQLKLIKDQYKLLKIILKYRI